MICLQNYAAYICGLGSAVIERYEFESVSVRIAFHNTYPESGFTQPSWVMASSGCRDTAHLKAQVTLPGLR